MQKWQDVLGTVDAGGSSSSTSVRPPSTPAVAAKVPRAMVGAPSSSGLHQRKNRASRTKPADAVGNQTPDVAPGGADDRATDASSEEEIVTREVGRDKPTKPEEVGCARRTWRWLKRTSSRCYHWALAWVRKAAWFLGRAVEQLKQHVQLRWWVQHFLDDGVVVISVVIALSDECVLSMPYIVLPAIYLQMGASGYSENSLRTIDKLLAHWALLDSMRIYLSFLRPTGNLLNDFIAVLNRSQWIDTELPARTDSAIALRILLIAAYSARGLFDSTPVITKAREFTTGRERLASILAPEELLESGSTGAFLKWFNGTLITIGYTSCLIMWSVVSVTPGSVVTMAIAMYEVCIRHSTGWSMGRFRSPQLYLLQVLLFVQWCIGIGGVTIPSLSTYRQSHWKRESQKTLVLGVMAVVLLSKLRAFCREQDRHGGNTWIPNEETLARMQMVRKNGKWLMFLVLVICSFGKASVIHLLYLMLSRLYVERSDVGLWAWIVLAALSYTFVIAALLWQSLYPPLFSDCTHVLGPDSYLFSIATWPTVEQGSNSGSWTLMSSLNYCNVDLGSFESYLSGETLSSICPDECGTNNDVRDVATNLQVKQSDVYELIGIHACHLAQECRFNSFGWSVLIAAFVSIQLGLSIFCGVYDESRHGASAAMPKKKRRSRRVPVWVRFVLRSLFYLVILWFVLVTHLADGPKFSSWCLAPFILVFIVAFLKVDHLEDEGKCCGCCKHRPRQLLAVLWILVTILLSTALFFEYVYTLDYVSTIIDDMVSGFLISDTDEHVNATFSKVLTISELGLVKNRDFNQQVQFFIKVFAFMLAVIAVKRFSLARKQLVVRTKPKSRRKGHHMTELNGQTSGSAYQFESAHRKLYDFHEFISKVLARLAPKIMLIVVYTVSQVEPLKLIFAVYLIPVTVLLAFPHTHKKMWFFCSVYSASAWLVTYSYQFQYFHVRAGNFDFNSAWGLEKLPTLWHSKLLGHIAVLLATMLYRSLCSGKKLDGEKGAANKPLFDNAWPYVTQKDLDGHRMLQLKFLVSNFLLGFGDVIFYMTCLISATTARDNFSIVYVLNLAVFFLSDAHAPEDAVEVTLDSESGTIIVARLRATRKLTKAASALVTGLTVGTRFKLTGAGVADGFYTVASSGNSSTQKSLREGDDLKCAVLITVEESMPHTNITAGSIALASGRKSQAAVADQPGVPRSWWRCRRQRISPAGVNIQLPKDPKRRKFKWMRISFASLVILQCCVWFAALSDSVIHNFSINDNTESFNVATVLRWIMKALLYFSSNANDGSRSSDTDTIGKTSFAVMFVLSTIINNEYMSKKMAQTEDTRIASNPELENFRQDTHMAVKQLEQAIVRLCFIHNIDLSSAFQEHLPDEGVVDKVMVNGKPRREYRRCCTMNQFVTIVLRSLAHTRLGELHSQNERLRDLLAHLVNPDSSWGMKSFMLTYQDEGDVHTKIDEAGSEAYARKTHQDIVELERKAHCLFDHFDRDQNGFMDLHETRIMQAATTTDTEVTDVEFAEIAKRLGADPAQGFTVNQFTRTYADLDLARELGADIDADYSLVFPYGEHLTTSGVLQKSSNSIRQVSSRSTSKTEMVLWQDFCGAFATDVQDRVMSLGNGFVQPNINALNPQPSQGTFSIWNTLWTVVLVVVVDSMAFVIGWVCLNVAETTEFPDEDGNSAEVQFSAILMGYLTFALLFLRAQRSENDFDMLRTLHLYAYFHILLQSLYMFFDPLLQFSEDTTLKHLFQHFIGLEQKNVSYASSSVSIYSKAAGLFAWIIVVTTLQKSKGYASMRLNVKSDQQRSIFRSFLRLSEQLRGREKALAKIKTTLHRLDNTAKRIRMRRGSISLWHEARIKVQAMATELSTKQPMLKVDRVELNFLDKYASKLTKTPMQSSAINGKVSCSFHLNEAHSAVIKPKPLHDGRTLWEDDLPVFLPPSAESELTVRIIEEKPHLGNVLDSSLVTNEVHSQVVLNLRQLQPHEDSSECYLMHTPTSEHTYPTMEMHLKFAVRHWHAKKEKQMKIQSNSPAPHSLHHNPFESSSKPKAGQSLERLRRARMVANKNLFVEMTKLIRLQSASPRKWAVYCWLTRNKHRHMLPSQATAAFSQTSTAESMYMICHHYFISHTAALCYFLVFLNQIVNHNLFSSILFFSLFGCVICEFPGIPSGFWSFALAFVQCEVILRAFLNISYFEVHQQCFTYHGILAEQVDGSDTISSPFPFICGAMNPSSSITVLLVLLLAILVHRYKMKRQGVWQYWTPYEKRAKAIHGRLQAKIAEKKDSVITTARDILDTSGNLSDASLGQVSSDDSDDDPNDEIGDNAGNDIPSSENSLMIKFIAIKLRFWGDAGSPDESLENQSVFNPNRKNGARGFLPAFYSNVLRQDDPLDEDSIDSILSQLNKQQDGGFAEVGVLLSLGGHRHGRMRIPSTVTPTQTDGGVPQQQRQAIESLLRKSTYKTAMDTYVSTFIVEILSMVVIVIVQATVAGSGTSVLSDVQDVVSNGYISGAVVWLTVLQFAFMVAERAAYLMQNIQFKFFLLWLSMVVYHCIIFYWALPTVENEGKSTAWVVTLFVLKCLYWTQSGRQIRHGYQHDTTINTGKSHRIIGETHKVRHYAAVVFQNLPFVVDIRTALSWIFIKTTLRYEDCKRLDELSNLMFLIKCKFARADDLNRRFGGPQPRKEKILIGTLLMAMFFIYIWGPLIIFSLMNSLLDYQTNNVIGAKVSVHISTDRGNMPLFESQLLTRLKNSSNFQTPQSLQCLVFGGSASTSGVAVDSACSRTGTLSSDRLYGSRVSCDPSVTCPDIYSAASHMSTLTTDERHATSVVEVSQYSDSTWQPSEQLLNATSEYISASPDSVHFETLIELTTANGTVSPFSFRSRSLDADDTAHCGQSVANSSSLGRGEANLNVVRQMLTTDTANMPQSLCVPISGAFPPFIDLNYDTSTKVSTPTARDSDSMENSAKACLCLLSQQNADGSLKSRVWQLLHRSGDGHSLQADTSAQTGPKFVILSERLPSGLAENVASIGLIGLYVSVVWQISRGMKVAKFKLLHDITYEDRDAAIFVHQLCQDLYTARKFAKLDPRYFFLEERMWVQLQYLMRDTGKLLEVVQLERQKRRKREDAEREFDLKKETLVEEGLERERQLAGSGWSESDSKWALSETVDPRTRPSGDLDAARSLLLQQHQEDDGEDMPGGDDTHT